MSSEWTVVRFTLLIFSPYDRWLSPKSYLIVEFLELSFSGMKNGGSHLKNSIWPLNDRSIVSRHFKTTMECVFRCYTSNDCGNYSYWLWIINFSPLWPLTTDDLQGHTKHIPNSRISRASTFWYKQWGFPFKKFNLTTYWPVVSGHKNVTIEWPTQNLTICVWNICRYLFNNLKSRPSVWGFINLYKTFRCWNMTFQSLFTIIHRNNLHISTLHNSREFKNNTNETLLLNIIKII